MIDYSDFRAGGTGPIYQQIADHIKKGIAEGTVTDGDELPSRRELSALLGINPNTVQKAFRILEDEGLIASRMGAKSCITLESPGIRDRIRTELIMGEIRMMAGSLKQMNVTKEEALRILGACWEDER